MFPIFEQGKKRGINHSLDSFLERFITICTNAKKNNIRKTFAFILYNFENQNLRKILKDDGVLRSWID